MIYNLKFNIVVYFALHYEYYNFVFWTILIFLMNLLVTCLRRPALKSTGLKWDEIEFPA
jgi:hypothetical protein